MTSRCPDAPCLQMRQVRVRDTQFDTAGRSTPREIDAMATGVRAHSDAMSLLNGMSSPAFLLNHQRQVVVANGAGTRLFRRFGRSTVEGLRLGEGVACVNAPSGSDGCGTSSHCRYCGIGVANRKFGLRPATYDAEFRLRSVDGERVVDSTFHAHLAPVEMDSVTYRLCSLEDITAIRSREVLDQIFFHDVLNTAQAVEGAATLLPGLDDQQTVDELAQVVSTSASTLVNEIEAQRDLLQAEDGSLAVTLTPQSVWDVVAETAELYRRSRFGKGRAIDLAPLAGDGVIPTSRVHLARCVGNLLKNALEASTSGERVSVGVLGWQDEITISVHNPAPMPESVQAQVFQHFFSTKARTGRGLGTYSVRLLVSQYLRGSVGFHSSAAEGTTFTIQLPRAARPRAASPPAASA